MTRSSERVAVANQKARKGISTGSNSSLRSFNRAANYFLVRTYKQNTKSFNAAVPFLTLHTSFLRTQYPPFTDPINTERNGIDFACMSQCNTIETEIMVHRYPKFAVICTVVSCLWGCNLEQSSLISTEGRRPPTPITASASGEGLVLNELLASSAYKSPDRADWIEIHNAGKRAINLKGYSLTDSLRNPGRWRITADLFIEAGGFRLVHADAKNLSENTRYDSRTILKRLLHWWKYKRASITPADAAPRLHTNFRLASTSGELGLFSPSGKLVDSIEYGLQVPDVSFGRVQDQGWRYCLQPTPGTPNDGPSARNTGTPSRVKLEPRESFQPEPFSITLTTDEPDAVIRYELGGAKPTAESPIYHAPIKVERTTTLRTCLFLPDSLPGPCATKTYIINEMTSLPIACVTADPADLWGPTGIYENPAKKINKDARDLSTKNVRIPVHVEMWQSNRTKTNDMDAGMQMHGKTTLGLPQKSLGLYARSKYGEEAFRGDLFPGSGLDSFGSLILRNGGQDWCATLLTESTVKALSDGYMDIDHHSCAPYVVFINGQYWGIHNLREKSNADYLKTHYGHGRADLDILEENQRVVTGDRRHWDRLTEHIHSSDRSDEASLAFVENQIDINAFINFQIMRIYIGYYGLSHNRKAWRPRTHGGKWRWMLFDVDQTLGISGTRDAYLRGDPYGASTNHLAVYINPNNSIRPSEDYEMLFIWLLKHNSFRHKFAQTFAMHLNSTFAPVRLLEIIEQKKQLIEAEMPRHIDRWKSSPTFVQDINNGLSVNRFSPIQSIADWEESTTILTRYANHRPAYMRQHLMRCLELGRLVEVQCEVKTAAAGQIRISGVPTRSNLFHGKFFRDSPLQLEAIPHAGYSFRRWVQNGVPAGTERELILTPDRDTVLVAEFEPGGMAVLPAEIDGVLTLRQEDSPYLAQGDVAISKHGRLHIEAGVTVLMPQDAEILVRGALVIQGTNSQPVRIRPNTTAGCSRWGAICIDSAQGPVILEGIDIRGASNGRTRNRFPAAISSINSLVTLNNSSIADSGQPVSSMDGHLIVKNSRLSCGNTGDLVHVVRGRALVQDNDLKGSGASDLDAIDFDGVANGRVVGNIVSGCVGSSGDGIDLGEQSDNIIVANNLILGCRGKGVSVGQASTAVVTDNVIVGCKQGISVKDFGSQANIVGNVFLRNHVGVACFEENKGKGGGGVLISNCIFYKSLAQAVWSDNRSTASVNYCITSNSVLTGTENLVGSPDFLDVQNLDLSLAEDSLGKNSGAPTALNDPDGSRADIGGRFEQRSISNEVLSEYQRLLTVSFADIVITEIHYNPSRLQEDEYYEFIEICNRGNSPADISGYSFVRGIDFEFPLGTTIAPKECVLVCAASEVFSQQGLQVFQWNRGKLSNAGEALELLDSRGEIVDLVNYDNRGTWPKQADGGGSSAELLDMHTDNDIGSNWRASVVAGGTPGWIPERSPP